MATNTYVALRTETVAVATGSVTFDLTGISGYTDLVIVANGTGASNFGLRAQFNADTATNYSLTVMGGSGSAVTSERQTNVNYARFVWNSLWNTTSPGVAIINIQNYANTTTYKTVLWRSSTASNAVEAGVNTWRSTAAINSIKIDTSTGANIAVGSTFSLYGIAAQPVPTAKATGGTISYDIANDYWYHTFTSSGTFTPTEALTADILVVAGGGSGGGIFYGAGGGAGGLQGFTNQSLTTTGHTVTVGAGGSFSGNVGGNGNNSSFASLTQSVGGGRGSNQYTTPGNGGSGGGGSTSYNTGGTGTVGQGNNGGNTSGTGSAAGGGAGGGVANNSASGGIGLSTYSDWGAVTLTGDLQNNLYYYAGGGAGNVGAHGFGGGGGSTRTGTTNVAKYTGMVNTGGGGGSAGDNGGYSGGSGIVIIRYAN